MKSYFRGSALALMVIASPALAEQPTEAPHFIAEQPSNQWLSSLLVGQQVTNKNGESIGRINDLLFDQSGHITFAVLGVGSFLGIGGKNVAVPFGSFVFGTGKDGERTVTIDLGKEALQQAPEFKPVEKSTFTKAIEKYGEKAMEKGRELKDEAAKKIEDMQKEEPKTEPKHE